MRINLLGALIILSIISSCGVQKVYTSNDLFSSNHCGFYLKDPVSGNILADINASKYFTPASNTKIFTLYAGIKTFQDSLPSVRYRVNGDSLILWGTGDPTFLNPEFNQNKTFEFIENSGKQIFLSIDNFQDKPMGPGWAWDDYNYSYSLEKSSFPMYGNKFDVHKGKDTTHLMVVPSFFEKFLYTNPAPAPISSNYLNRDISSNLTTYYSRPDSVSFTRSIPIRWDKEFLRSLLSDTLKTEVNDINEFPSNNSKYLYVTSTDSVFQTMMQESDNFLAEQILLMVSGLVSDTLRTDIAIEHVKSSYLSDLPDEPLWYDGSGLSRYNLFTPRTIASLLEKIYNEVDHERLFKIFASGGVNGTIKNWYGGKSPYVYAKTGTLRNNHCLSGYIITKKGKTLIFSFMNNNYNDISSSYKVEMQKILEYVYNKY